MKNYATREPVVPLSKLCKNMALTRRSYYGYSNVEEAIHKWSHLKNYTTRSLRSLHMKMRAYYSLSIYLKMLMRICLFEPHFYFNHSQYNNYTDNNNNYIIITNTRIVIMYNSIGIMCHYLCIFTHKYMHMHECYLCTSYEYIRICTHESMRACTLFTYPHTRAVLRLVWPSILLQSARGRVATAAAMERHVRKTA